MLNLGFSATTGKISGRVTDALTGEPLVGVNILLVDNSGETIGGAATNQDGYYIILNIHPGNYTLKVNRIGYKTIIINDVPVHTDFTTNQDFELIESTVEMKDDIIVLGRRPDIQRDRTSTMAVMGANQIEKLPVTDFQELINMQAGVIDGHFRGGRAGEVAYLLDGVSISDPYNGSRAVEIENSSIKEVKVISGTFSAEYGQAMSGVVNVITKAGSQDFGINLETYAGDYFSSHDDIFYHIDDIDPTSIKNIELNIQGGVPLIPKTTFYLSGRMLSSDGYLFGKTEFIPSDSSNMDDPNPENWTIERSGSGKIVSMNSEDKISLNGKISSVIFEGFTLKLQGNYSDRGWKEYDHYFKYNPKGILNHYQDQYHFSIGANHVIKKNLFYTLKYNQIYTNYESYTNSNPYSEDYVNPQLLRRLGYGFYTGGMNMNHFYRNTKINTVKWNLVYQMNQQNEIKTGWEYRLSNLWLHRYSIFLDRTTDWQPEIYPPESVNNNEYRHKPQEFALWLEDKIEFKRIILTLGLRWDYFEPDGLVPKDLRDPRGEYKSVSDPYKEATPKQQWSPRLGMSYPITDKGAIHISYGHFFQIPNFQYLYRNSEFEVQGGGYLNTIMGNADLKPKKTTIYQIGLQQMIAHGLVLELTGYYKDIRDLVSTEIHELYILGDRYARYINRDYGNVRGIAFTLTQKPIGILSGSIDYTYQIAEGNASDPEAVFHDRQSAPPRASEIQTVPLDWDQRHTLNLSLNLSKERWGADIIASLGSGMPYTPEYKNQRTYFENSERKPYTLSMDLNANYSIPLHDSSIRLYMQVKNLFDRLNAKEVFNDTGDPDNSLIPTYVPEQPIYSLNDFLTRPDYYFPPRRIIVGIKVKL